MRPVASAHFVPRLLPPAFFERDVDRVARDLIGAVVVVDGVGGAIVETESYDSRDPASHTYGARVTPRNGTMFGPSGHAYVYRCYGIHWCLNVVCGPGSAVLVRALEPLYGIARMEERRGAVEFAKLCAGPGRLCEALGISGKHDGHSLLAPPFALYAPDLPVAVRTGVRVGISKAREAPRRFGMVGSRFISRPFAQNEDGP